MLMWLLEHPGASPVLMARRLGIAESTRRSNLCRLRAWLGQAPDGRHYLPYAYDGRIQLAPMVTADYMEARDLLRGAPRDWTDANMEQALKLVRGTMCAGRVWPWAEKICADMTWHLHIAARTLLHRAEEAGDLRLAYWAALRGYSVNPVDTDLRWQIVSLEHRLGMRTA
jgi:hypothetical protein